MERVTKIKLAAGLFGFLAIGSLGMAAVMVPEVNPPQRHSKAIISKVGDEILRRACFDCHSNETQWPWYGNIPFVSLLVAHDIADGRKHLNFSEWDSYSPERRRRKMGESLEEIQQGEMPMWIYTLTHGDATLSAREVAVLRSGIEAQYGPLKVHEKQEEDEHHDD
jgi:hypothetical protein